MDSPNHGWSRQPNGQPRDLLGCQTPAWIQRLRPQRANPWIIIPSKPTIQTLGWCSATLCWPDIFWLARSIYCRWILECGSIRSANLKVPTFQMASHLPTPLHALTPSWCLSTSADPLLRPATHTVQNIRHMIAQEEADRHNAAQPGKHTTLNTGTMCRVSQHRDAWQYVKNMPDHQGNGHLV